MIAPTTPPLWGHSVDLRLGKRTAFGRFFYASCEFHLLMRLSKNSCDLLAGAGQRTKGSAWPSAPANAHRRCFENFDMESPVASRPARPERCVRQNLHLGRTRCMHSPFSSFPVLRRGACQALAGGAELVPTSNKGA